MSFLDTATSLKPVVGDSNQDTKPGQNQLSNAPVDDSGAPGEDSTNVGYLQFQIVEYLKSVPNHDFVSTDQLLEGTGIDIDSNPVLRKTLQVNSTVEVNDQDQFRFRASFGITSVSAILRELRERPNGFVMDEIIDCYTGIEEDIRQLVSCGIISVVKNKSNNKLRLFARNAAFYTKLSPVIPKKGRGCATTTTDLQDEVRRGDVVLLGDKVPALVDPAAHLSDDLVQLLVNHSFRVSILDKKTAATVYGDGNPTIVDESNSSDSKKNTDQSGAVKVEVKQEAGSSAPEVEKKPSTDKNSNGTRLSPRHASAAVAYPLLTYTAHPYSASSVADMEENRVKRTGFFWRFTDKKLPLDPPCHFDEANGTNKIPLYKLGCTNDIRKLWWSTAEKHKIRWPEDKQMLDQKLIQSGALSAETVNEDIESAKRKRSIREKAQRAETKRRRKPALSRSKNNTNAHMLR